MSGQRQLGSRYEIGELLGRGGMGEVYRGRVLSDDSEVAIKVLRAEYATDRKLVGRLIQERDILVALSHPNLVRVHDLVAEGSDLAIVMDLIEGGDLRQTLDAAGGTLPPARALEIAAQILEALALVHASGVVHRDVKPENILMPSGPNLIARLSDFGVARVVSTSHAHSTHTSVIGTPYYMAPEVADAQRAHGSADIYSMGCTLYELLCGTVPFTGSPLSVLRRHADEAPSAVEGLASDIQVFLDTLLAKDPRARPEAAAAAQSARVLAEAHAGTAALSTVVAPPSLSGPFEFAPGAADPAGHPRYESDGRSTIARRPMPRFGVTLDEATETATRSKPARRLLMALASFVLVALAGALVIATRDNEPAVAVGGTIESRVALTPIIYENGMITTGSWTMTNKDNILAGSFEVANSTSDPLSGEAIEYFPKSMVADVDQIDFHPPPDRIIDRDPIVAYQVNDLAPGASRTFEYTIDTGVSTASPADRLADWLRERAESLHVPVMEVTELTFVTASVELTVGQSAEVAFTVTLNNGQPAPDAILESLAFRVLDATIVTVAEQRAQVVTLSALAAGTTEITAQVGEVSATLPIRVTGVDSPPDGVNVQASGGATSGGGRARSASGGPAGANPGLGVPIGETPVTTTISRPPGAVPETTTGATTRKPTNPEPKSAPKPDPDPPTATPSPTARPTPKPTEPTSPKPAEPPTTPSPAEPPTAPSPEAPTTPRPVEPPTNPCWTDVGGNGPYPAERAHLTGGSLARTCDNGGFRGTGYIGNWGQTGESVTFTVDASSAGRHNIVLRFRNARGTTTRRIDTPGGSDTITFHRSSNAWTDTNWSEAVVNIALTSGSNTVTLTATGSDSFLDLDEIASVYRTGPNGYSGSPGAIDGTITSYEAENAPISGIFIGPAGTNPGYTGSGYIGRYGYVGNSVAFTVEGGGTRTLRFRYRAIEARAGRRLVSVNGQSVFVLTFPATAPAWEADAWGEAVVTVNLPSGPTTVTLGFLGDSGFGFIDLDRLDVVG